MNRRSLPPRSLSSDQLPRRKSPMQTSATDVPLVMDDQPSAPLRSVLRTASSSTSSKGLKPSTTNKDVASIFSNRSISVSEHRVRPSRDLSRHNSSQHLQKRLSSKRLDSLERTTSDASLDTSLLPRRGRKRQGLNNLSISSRDNNSFILNNSQHSFSSEESFHAGSFREKTTSSSSHRPRPINKSTIVLSVIWSLALFCLGGLFAQNYAVITDRSTVKFGDELHRDGKASGEGFIRNQEQHGAQVTTTQHREKPSKFRNSFVENTKSLEQFQILHGVDSIRKVITAYTESPLLDTVPGTGSRDNPNDKSFGVVPTFIIPLPRRATTPDDLKEHLYPAARTCHDLPAKFPVDEGLQLDAETGQQIVWNLGKEPTPTDFPEAQAKHCPVEMDPFLPWIHDVVASSDGSKIEFVAQNMRRCRTGKAQTDNVNRLVPQVTLMQAVSVQRINESLAQDLAPELWKGDTTANDNTARYRLAPLEEASHDGKETRFICRFHTTRVENGTLVDVILGETLSEFPFNYEFLSYRKEKRSLLSPKGTDGALFWASSLQFNCPTPNITALRTAIALGTTVSQDGSATLHVDIAPIRTSVRYDEVYLSDNQIGPHAKRVFDPVTRWGAANVLPRFEASGRWANIPICRPPKSIVQKEMTTSLAKSVKDEQNVNSVWTESTSLRLPQSTNGSSTKLHYLSACLWASAEFKQRGESRLKNSDTTDRLQEWIEFHLLAGFDHIYVYDNSGAHTNETSLEPILNQYPSTQVTRIDWPSTVCNNNRPSDDSPGERSSQYAAETSCRVYVSKL